MAICNFVLTYVFQPVRDSGVTVADTVGVVLVKGTAGGDAVGGGVAAGNEVTVGDEIADGVAAAVGGVPVGMDTVGGAA